MSWPTECFSPIKRRKRCNTLQVFRDKWHISYTQTLNQWDAVETEGQETGAEQIPKRSQVRDGEVVWVQISSPHQTDDEVGNIKEDSHLMGGEELTVSMNSNFQCSNLINNCFNTWDGFKLRRRKKHDRYYWLKEQLKPPPWARFISHLVNRWPFSSHGPKPVQRNLSTVCISPNVRNLRMNWGSVSSWETRTQNKWEFFSAPDGLNGFTCSRAAHR